MKYIIGVDGGGTKTSIKAFTLGGDFVGGIVAGGTNYNFGDVDSAAANLASAISALCPDAGEIYIGFGDCSLDEGAENPKAALFEAKLRKALGVKFRLYARSDAFMALYGHTRGREGVVMISGTGAMGLACDRYKRLHTVGGWGRLTGDEGSAYYIALSGIKAALRAYDGVGSPTSLTEALPKHFGCGAIRELIGVFYGQNPPEIAPFAEVVYAQAKLGDAVSLSILCRTAEFLAGYTVRLIEKLFEANPGYENKSVGVVGSVLNKNDIVRAEYERLLRQSYPELIVKQPGIGPEEAAALYVRDNFL